MTPPQVAEAAQVRHRYSAACHDQAAQHHAEAARHFKVAAASHDLKDLVGSEHHANLAQSHAVLATEQHKLLDHDHPASYPDQEYGELQVALGLTPSQAQAWQRLLDSEHAWAEFHLDTPVDEVNKGVLERDEIHLVHLQADIMHMKARIAAVKGLYAVFTPAQKRIFDDFHAVIPVGRSGFRRGTLESVS